jgi:hypothetical protein
VWSKPNQIFMSTTTLPKLVRQVGMVTDHRDASAKEAEVRERAMKYAKEIGITSPDVKAFWRPYYFCDFTDYPMYLLGPGAPKLETCEDCLAHSNSAQYVVVIREKEN